MICIFTEFSHYCHRHCTKWSCVTLRYVIILWQRCNMRRITDRYLNFCFWNVAFVYSVTMEKVQIHISNASCVIVLYNSQFMFEKEQSYFSHSVFEIVFSSGFRTSYKHTLRDFFIYFKVLNIYTYGLQWLPSSLLIDKIPGYKSVRTCKAHWKILPPLATSHIFECAINTERSLFLTCNYCCFQKNKMYASEGTLKRCCSVERYLILL
jgi:hypothetical protein